MKQARLISCDGKLSIRMCTVDEEDDITFVPSSCIEMNGSSIEGIREKLILIGGAMSKPTQVIPKGLMQGYLNDEIWLEE